MLIELKGPGKVIAIALTETQYFELIRYADESMAICKQGICFDLWEADRSKECWAYFCKLAKTASHDRIHLVVISPDALRRISANQSPSSFMN